MSPTPSVSIITPFFNSCRFLSDAVESVLGQIFNDWELLLVDDGSTDASPEIARGYVSRHPERIHYLRHSDHRNHGLTATRNLALRSCRGQFVALLDSDDVWYPPKLTQQVDLLRRYPEAGMVFGRSEYWFECDKVNTDGKMNSIPELAPGNRLYYPPDLIKISYPLGRLGSPCPSDLIFRRTTLEQIGGFEEDFTRVGDMCEDLALLTKTFLAVPVYVSDECWDRYRLHPNSMWFRAQADRTEDVSKAFYFRWLRDYLSKIGVADPEVWRLYKRHAWKYRHTFIAACIRCARRLARPLKSVSLR